MIPKAPLFALLALEPACLFASDAPAPLNPLEVASRQADIFNHSDRPFVMDVDFTVQVNPAMPTQGHLRIRWEASDRWWSRVSLGKFEQVKLQKGEWTYTSRNLDFTPMQIRDLLELLHVGKGFDKLVTRAAKQRSEGGVRLDCVEAQNPDFKREHYTICSDPTTHDIVTETRRSDGPASEEVDRELFSDFIDFGEHRYPRKLESLKNGHPYISASVTALQESSLDPKLMVPQAGAIERRECPGIKVPKVLVSSPEPDHDTLSQGRKETDVQITILADGTVGNIQLVGSAGSAPDDPAVMAAIKKWKFAPAMCGTDPVVFDTYLEMVFDAPGIR